MQDSGARRGEDRGRDRGVPALPALGAGVHQGQRRAERSAAGVGGAGRPPRRLGALAGVRIDAKQIERTAEALKREIAAAERIVVTEPAPSPRRRCIRGAGRHWRAGAPSEIDPAARPGPARSSWPPCGPPNRATATAVPTPSPGRSSSAIAPKPIIALRCSSAQRTIRGLLESTSCLIAKSDVRPVRACTFRPTLVPCPS